MPAWVSLTALLYPSPLVFIAIAVQKLLDCREGYYLASLDPSHLDFDYQTQRIVALERSLRRLTSERRPPLFGFYFLNIIMLNFYHLQKLKYLFIDSFFFDNTNKTNQIGILEKFESYYGFF